MTGVRLSSIRKSRFAIHDSPRLSASLSHEAYSSSVFLRRSSRVPSLTMTSVARRAAASGEICAAMRRRASSASPPFGFPAPDAFGLRRHDEQHAVGLRLGPRLEELRRFGDRDPSPGGARPRRSAARSPACTSGWIRASRSCRRRGRRRRSRRSASGRCGLRRRAPRHRRAPRGFGSLAPRPVEVPHDLVRVEDDRAELLQVRRDRGLSRGEAAGQTDAEHGSKCYEREEERFTGAAASRPRRPS